MVFFEIIGYGIIAVIMFLMAGYVALSFMCAIDDIKEIIVSKRRIKHE